MDPARPQTTRGSEASADTTRAVVVTPPLTVRVVADGPATGEAYALLDVYLPGGTILPPHAVAEAHGLLVVLSGRLSVVLDGARQVVGPDDHLALPRGRPRRLTALTDTRLLCLAVPAGLERLAELATDPAPDRDDLLAHLAAAGIALLPSGWGTDAV